MISLQKDANNRIIYIEYREHVPFIVVTINKKMDQLTTWVFKTDESSVAGLVFKKSGSRKATIKDLQAPYISFNIKGATFWKDTKSNFRVIKEAGGASKYPYIRRPVNIKSLDMPHLLVTVLQEKTRNPFEIAEQKNF